MSQNVQRPQQNNDPNSINNHNQMVASQIQVQKDLTKMTSQEGYLYMGIVTGVLLFLFVFIYCCIRSKNVGGVNNNNKKKIKQQLVQQKSDEVEYSVEQKDNNSKQAMKQ